MLSAVGNLTNHHLLRSLVPSTKLHFCLRLAHFLTRGQILIYLLSSHRVALKLFRWHYQMPFPKALLHHMSHRMVQLFFPGKGILLLRQLALLPHHHHHYHPQCIPPLVIPHWCGHRRLRAVVRRQTLRRLYRTGSAVLSLISGHPLALARYSNSHLHRQCRRLCRTRMLQQRRPPCAGLAPGST
jgi:hypothetical protein